MHKFLIELTIVNTFEYLKSPEAMIDLGLAIAWPQTLKVLAIGTFIMECEKVQCTSFDVTSGVIAQVLYLCCQLTQNNTCLPIPLGLQVH